MIITLQANLILVGKFLTHLCDIDKHTATQWLHTHLNQIDKKSTVDLHKDFLNPSSN